MSSRSELFGLQRDSTVKTADTFFLVGEEPAEAGGIGGDDACGGPRCWSRLGCWGWLHWLSGSISGFVRRKGREEGPFLRKRREVGEGPMEGC